jgi:hypothetical protein
MLTAYELGQIEAQMLRLSARFAVMIGFFATADVVNTRCGNAVRL